MKQENKDKDYLKYREAKSKLYDLIRDNREKENKANKKLEELKRKINSYNQ